MTDQCCNCRSRSFSGRTTLWITPDNGDEVLWRRRYKSEVSSSTCALVDGLLFSSYQQAADPYFELLDVSELPFLRIDSDSVPPTGRSTEMNSVSSLVYSASISRVFTDGTVVIRFACRNGALSGTPALIFTTDYPAATDAWTKDNLRFDGTSYGLLARNADPLYPGHEMIPPVISAGVSIQVYAIEKNWVWTYTYLAGTFGTGIPGNPPAPATRTVNAVTRLSSSNSLPGQLYYHDGAVWALGYHTGSSTMKLESWDPAGGGQLSSVTVSGISAYCGCIWVNDTHVWTVSANGNDLILIDRGSGTVISTWTPTYPPTATNGPIGLGPSNAFLCDEDTFVYVIPTSIFSPGTAGRLVKYSASGHVYTKSVNDGGVALPARDGRVVWTAGNAARTYDATGTEVGTLPSGNMANLAILPGGVMAMAGNLPS